MTTERWKNRIVGSGEEAPDQLLANPKNYRVHPQAQQATLESVLDRVGWVRPVIVNRLTGFIVDGHMRVAVALRRGERRIPVDYVELTEDEEDAVLATFDPISQLAATNMETLKGLVAIVQGTGVNMDAIAQAYRLSGVPTFGDGDTGVDGLKDGADRESVEERYATSQVRQIYLMMTQGEYETMIVRFRAIAVAHALETNLDVLLWLIDQYETEHAA